MVKISHRIEYAGLSVARALLQRMSLDRGTAFSAAMARPLSPTLRRRTFRNLRLALPDLSQDAQNRIVSGMADNLVRCAVEYLHLAEIRDTPDRIATTGIEHLEEARKAGRGAVLVSGHLGNWEAIRAACARVDWTPAIIYRRFNNLQFDAESQRLMRAFDAPIFHKGRSGTLGMLRHIRKGGAVLILSDQRFAGAPEIPFFGIPAKTALAPAELAKQYGAALLPVRGIRRGRASRFDVTIDAPLHIANDDMAPYDTMQEINRRLEAWIRETPDQYFWLHNRWGAKKDRPTRPAQ